MWIVCILWVLKEPNIYIQHTPQGLRVLRRPNQIVETNSIFKRNNAGLWIISATNYRDPLGDLAQRWCTMGFKGYINTHRSTDTYRLVSTNVGTL